MTTIFLILLSITVAISAMVVVLLVKFIRRQKKAERLIVAFDNIAAEFNLEIVKQDQPGSRVVGLDAANGKLLFLGGLGFEHNGYLVDLEKIEKISVKTNYTNSATNGGSSIADISMIALKLNYRNATRPLLLPFFIKAIDPATEVQYRAALAKKWQTLLSSAFDGRSRSSRNITLIRPLSNTRLLIRGQYTIDQLN